MTRPTREVFAELLQKAVTEPGIISQAYRQFHQYSIGNQLLALGQCVDRGIQPGPINTFPGWKALGRWVRKGEKAITLCMPITVKRTPKTHVAESDAPAPRLWPRWVSGRVLKGSP